MRNLVEFMFLLFWLLVYLAVGWYLYGIIFAVLRRFLLNKWSLLASLGTSVLTVNAVGVVRAVRGLLELPPRTEGQEDGDV